MRYVIFGAGAIGGVVGARLHQSGHEVLLIARGDHHDAIAKHGLTMLSPTERETFKIPVTRDAASAGLREGDVILLCVKTQDAIGALLDIRDAVPGLTLPIVCMQNGVASEELALRLFPDVYGAVLLIPAEHLEPGVVAGYGARFSGRVDIGRYPDGVDSLAEEVCGAIAKSRFESDARPDIMVHKYAKLINNLVNGVDAICGPDQQASKELVELAREEARKVLRAAEVEFEVDEVNDVVGRWKSIGFAPIDGHGHRGGSSWQSVMRGTGSIETDYLNGEIVLRGRKLGIPTPVNATIQGLARETVSARHQPGWLTPGQVLDSAEIVVDGTDGRSSVPGG